MSYNELKALDDEPKNGARRVEVTVNEQGGVEPQNKRAAKLVNLLTLPLEVKGANCENCRYYNSFNKLAGFCHNPKVKQFVNKRMHCALWSTPGELKEYS